MSVSERRREGYPPEGPRPRSGLGRVARSRSDAPRLFACIPAPVSIIGTIMVITNGTIACISTASAGVITGSISAGSGVTGTVPAAWRDARLKAGRA